MQAELFKDRTAIVTGGARGIGLACAAKIAGGGGRVALWDRDIDRAKQSAASLGNAIAVEVDVTSEESVAPGARRHRGPARPARHPGRQRRHHRPQHDRRRAIRSTPGSR